MLYNNEFSFFVSVVNELIGNLVGHLYFFLMFKYPMDLGGRSFLSTPQFLWVHSVHSCPQHAIFSWAMFMCWMSAFTVHIHRWILQKSKHVLINQISRVFMLCHICLLGIVGFPIDEVEFLDSVFPQAGDLCLRNRQEEEEEEEEDVITGVKVFGWGTTDPFFSWNPGINNETSNVNAAKKDFICFGIYLYCFFFLFTRREMWRSGFRHVFLLLMSRHTAISVCKSLQNSANHNGRKFRGPSLIVFSTIMPHYSLYAGFMLLIQCCY